MHDIICPQCGGRFIARDVAFDLSKYITSLLFDDPRELEDVQNAGFKFYADEESILTHTLENNKVPLFCEIALGPSGSESWYPYVITCGTLLDYIEAKLDNNSQSLRELLIDLMEIAEDRNASYNIQQVNTVQMLYQIFFAAALNTNDFSMDDDNVKTALRIMFHMLENEEKSLMLKVRLFSSKLNTKRPDYAVPDTLIIFDNGRSERINKCCRNCGAELPLEFGYYRIVPVILMGSHYSGKTSFLLAMLYTVRTKFAMHAVKSHIVLETLTNDRNLIAFDKNIERYQRGQPTLKTDFVNVPILNIRAGDCIYTFVDWPGEKFISAASERDNDYVFRHKPIIGQARHFLCFLEPSQVDHSVAEADENVQFPLMDLIERFRWHMSLPPHNKLRSFSCIINKFDVLEGKRNTSEVFDVMSYISETDIYSDGAWNDANFQKIDTATRQYIEAQSPILYSGFEYMSGFEKLPRFYLPVSPYGKTPEEAGEDIVINRNCLAGLPLFCILKADKMI